MLRKKFISNLVLASCQWLSILSGWLMSSLFLKRMARLEFVTGPDPDTLPGFPGWSCLVKFHCTIPKEDTVELHFKEGSKHMH